MPIGYSVQMSSAPGGRRFRQTGASRSVILTFSQPRDSFLRQPGRQNGGDHADRNTNDPAHQVAIDHRPLEDRYQEERADEQPKAERQEGHGDDLPQAAHVSGIHLARIVPIEFGSGGTKPQQDALFKNLCQGLPSR
jgi:hypothetical protein